MGQFDNDKGRLGAKPPPGSLKVTAQLDNKVAVSLSRSLTCAPRF
jgi:hypothetical protein